MDTHTTKEKQLKSDIAEKNIIRRELEQRLVRVHRWNDDIARTKNSRRKKKLESTIARYKVQIDDLKEELLCMNEDLEKRIKEEMAYSEDEIKAFQNDLEKHAKELQKIKETLTEDEKEKQNPEKEKQAAADKFHAQKLLKAEARKIRQDEKELESEARDKALFTLELKHIALDRKLFGA